MKANKETALRIYCALLARDPLFQQRFQDLSLRFAALSTIACEAANQFERMHEAFDGAGEIWNKHVAEPPPKQARTEQFLASVKSATPRPAKGELDLIDQMRKERA